MTVGRTKKTHLALRDGSVSQKHAEFRYDGAWNLVDVGSTNGTTVNGVSLEQDGKHFRHMRQKLAAFFFFFYFFFRLVCRWRMIMLRVMRECSHAPASGRR